MFCIPDGDLDGKPDHPQPDGIDSPGGENQDGCCCADKTKTPYTQDDIKVDAPSSTGLGPRIVLESYFPYSCCFPAGCTQWLQVAALLLISHVHTWKDGT